MLDLVPIKKRCDKATPGPWNYDERVGCVAVYPGEKVNCMCEAENKTLYYAGGFQVKDENGKFDHWDVNKQDCNNAKFIAHAREDIPALIAEIETLQAQLNGAKANTMIQESIIDKQHNPADSEKIVRLSLENADLRTQLTESQHREITARNELCLKCGRYHEAHKGACDGCRWKENN